MNKLPLSAHLAIIFTIFLLEAGTASAQSCQPASNPDLDDDGIVSSTDLYTVANSYGLNSSDPAFDPVADIDCSGTVDGVDIAFVQNAMGEEFPIAATPTTLDIESNRLSGVAGTQFQLTAGSIFSNQPIQSWRWDLGDGRSKTGQNIEVAYTEPGLYQVTVTGTDADGNKAGATVGLVVFDPNRTAPAVLNLPDTLGDIDGDEVVTLVDAHRIAKRAGGLEALPEARREAAELDFEDPVTHRDAELAAKAVLNDAPLPSTLLPASAQPGAAVTMVTPELLDPDGQFEVEVGESRYVQKLTRVARGYGTFMVPLDPTTENSIKVDPGPVEVRLLQSGSEVASFTLEVEAPTPIPEDPRARVKEILDRLDTLLELNRNALKAQLDDVGLTGKDRELMLASAIAAQRQAEAVFAEMRTVMDDPASEGLAKLILRQMNANGLQDLLERIDELRTGNLSPQSLPSGGQAVFSALDASPTAVCDEILPAYCTALSVAEALDTAGSVVGFLCDSLLVSAGIAVVVPTDGFVVDAATLSTWLGLCSQAEAAISVANTITGIVTKFDADLGLDISPRSLEPGETASIEVSINFIGLDDICAVGAGQGAGRLVTYIADRAVNELLRRKIGRTAARKIFELEGGGFLNDFLESLRGATATAVDRVGVGNAFQALADSTCGRFNVGGQLTADTRRLLRGPEPNVGALNYLANGTAEYTCPTPDMSGSSDEVVKFTAEKSICDETQTRNGTVTCGSSTLTITMGDNGNLNDDIYEIVFDGRTVLTSSAPVRRTSTTINVAPGDYPVQMLGRAAPDGVGTYYIQFGGDVTAVSGAAMSGTDLTPGVTKTFRINVE